MRENSVGTTTSRLTTRERLVCIAAAIGFAFDTYELLMLPLVLPPALADLGGFDVGSADFARWRDLMFYVPAVCGGIFGLLGGYLTDRLGRRRVLLWSILLYGCAAGASAFATSLITLFLLRCATFVGVCVEFAAAVAWLAELFPEPKRREAVLGLTQAFSSLGGLMVGGTFVLASKYGHALPPILGEHEAWRYTLLSGLIPAILLLVLRPFLPESPEWQRKKRAGTLQRPSVGELFSADYLRTTLVSALIFACGIGAAVCLQQLPQIIPGSAGVAALTRSARQELVGEVQMIQEVGGLAGRLALAALAVHLGSSPTVLRFFQVPGLIIVPLLFLYPAIYDVELLKWTVFVAGFLTMGQFSFWGNYLPRWYPVHLRGTGESFAANVGGRMAGASAALLVTQAVRFAPGAAAAHRLAYGVAGVAFLTYAVGLFASFYLRNPPVKDEQRSTDTNTHAPAN